MQTGSAPKTIDEFHERLHEVSGSMPKRLKQCADYIAANTEIIAVSTVAELAEGAGVQPSAFIRFCKLLGFSGFSELQRLFRAIYAERWPDYTTRLEKLKEEGAGSPSSLLAEFVEAGYSSLENLARTVDSKVLSDAVQILSKARMIHIVGLQRAFPVAAYLAYAFEKMSTPAMLHDGVGSLDHRHAIRSGDVLIAITFSPYSAVTLELAEYARSQGCPVVAITDSVNSPLRDLGAHVLTVMEVDFGKFRALSASLSLAITVAVGVGAVQKK
ncbi:MAG: MurR/RpiR family transcriptional regulator [Rhizobiaceae bacterium]|nr:MurR/RpiR family transcriptional regulator [Rhizobiaceae bacterium]